MPYIGGKLSAPAGAMAEVTALAARRLCDVGAEKMLTRAERSRPVRSAAVRAAWQKTVAERRRLYGFDSYKARVQNAHWRAHWAPGRVEPEDEQPITTPEGPRRNLTIPNGPCNHR